MSDTTTTTTDTTTTASDELGSAVGDQAPTETDATAGPNAEAARYRHRLRQAETELEATRALLSMMRTAEVERLAAEHLSQPADLFDVGRVALDDLLDDSGIVDPDRVTAAVKSLIQTRPGLAHPQLKMPDMGQGNRPRISQTSWSDVLQSR